MADIVTARGALILPHTYSWGFPFFDFEALHCDWAWRPLKHGETTNQDMALASIFMTDTRETKLFTRAAVKNGARTRQAASAHGLTVQYARTDPRKQSFAERTVESWNKLPDSIRSVPSIEAFKSRLGSSTVITSDELIAYCDVNTVI